MTNDFFTDLANTKPFFKAGFQGFAGTGKTFTAAKVAVGMHALIKSDKPIACFDTELAAQFLVPLFKKAGIEAITKQSRSLADLTKTMELCEAGAADILLIDSISHVWEDFLNAFQKKHNRTFLQFQDWGILKPAWKESFSEPFVRSKVHILMCGRAGYEYAQEVNEDTGKKEVVKVGVKMKVEGETAYEPDLLVQMGRFQEITSRNRLKVWREATILKDRADLIDGKTFKQPTFKTFAPVIKARLMDPSVYGGADETSAQTLFGGQEKKREDKKAKEIILEEIEGELTAEWPGSSAPAKKAKVEALENIFTTKSWTRVQGMSIGALSGGLARLKVLIHGEPENEKEADWMGGTDDPPAPADESAPPPMTAEEVAEIEREEREVAEAPA